MTELKWFFKQSEFRWLTVTFIGFVLYMIMAYLITGAVLLMGALGAGIGGYLCFIFIVHYHYKENQHDRKKGV